MNWTTGGDLINADEIDLDALIQWMEEGNIVCFPSSTMLGDVVLRIKQESPKNYFRFALEWAQKGEYTLGINRYNHMISTSLQHFPKARPWGEVWQMFVPTELPSISDLI